MLADSAYGSGPVRADLAAARPHRGDQAVADRPQPAISDDDQFHRDDFRIDYTARTVTCPAGITVTITANGNATFGAALRGCPLRSRCTASDNRQDRSASATTTNSLAAARADWRDGIGVDDYRQWRPMVERSIAWLVADGHRRVRYRGVERNRLGLSIRAAAINLRRLLNLGLTHNANGWTLAT